MKPIILTYIYHDFADEISSTHEFRRSCAHFGYDVINVIEGQRYEGHAQVFRELYRVLCELPASQPVVYADAADTFFLREINVPTDRILYSTEKAYWPPNETVGGQERYTHKKSRWCYLNGGAYCGPAGLLCEFYAKYGPAKYDGVANAQKMQHDAYFAALADGFPIELDQECSEFQSIAFEADDEFRVLDFPKIDKVTQWMVRGGVELEVNHRIGNNLTQTIPALIHGNGRTPMHHIYKLLP